MARAALVAMLGGIGLFGCNQSLFDSNPGDGDGDGDAGADGAIASTCPEPCAGDAFADFGETQGGSSGSWFYLGEGTAPSGVDYADLTFAQSQWSMGTAGGPSIQRCAGSADASCAGLEGFVVLAPGDGSSSPALAFRAPESATYQVSGAVRVADGSTLDVAAQFLLSRNGRHEAVKLSPLRTSTSEVAVSAVVTALAGDEIILSVNVADSTALGFRLFFTRIDSGPDAFPGACLAAVTFSDSDPLAETCRNATIQDLNDGIGPPGMSMVTSGPSGRLGSARDLAEGQYLRVGNSALDYAGDFTIQFYLKTLEPQPSFDTTPFADWENTSLGGISFFLDQDSSILDFCYMAHGSVTRDECLRGVRPIDGEWHLWRVVRSTADATLRLCIDGAENVQVALPGDADMTGNNPPHIGRNVTFNPAYLGGSIDDIRVFATALPCVTSSPGL